MSNHGGKKPHPPRAGNPRRPADPDDPWGFDRPFGFDDPWGFGGSDGTLIKADGTPVDVRPVAAPWPPMAGGATTAPPWPPSVGLVPAAPPGPVVADPDAFRPRRRRRAGLARAALAATVALVCAAGLAYLRRPAAAELDPGRVPAAGIFVLSSQPPGAHVVVDGESVGVTPLALSLAPGPHDVVATAANGITKRISAEVQSGLSTSQHVMLEPPPMPETPPLQVSEVTPATPPPATNGWVSFSLPFVAQVFDGDSFLGLSGDERLFVRPGTHTFTLVNEELGFRVAETVVVEPGRVTRRVVDPGTAALSIDAVPWGEVVIAGRSFGKTPLANIRLPLGVHQLALRHPSLGEHVLPVTIRRGESNHLSVDLRR